MAKEKITDVVERELAGFLPEKGYELYLTEYSKEGKDWYLKVFVDKPEEEKKDPNVFDIMDYNRTHLP